MAEFIDHDAYIAAAPDALRPMLVNVRSVLAQTLPDLEEQMRYGMPGFGTAGVTVAGYAAFSKQCGLYVHKGAIDDNAAAIEAAQLKPSKTGLTFSPARPISDDLIIALALASRKESGL
jgi:uncharacterized protein YdhG (YjbR/CyaY superfamily)